MVHDDNNWFSSFFLHAFYSLSSYWKQEVKTTLSLVLFLLALLMWVSQGLGNVCMSLVFLLLNFFPRSEVMMIQILFMLMTSHDRHIIFHKPKGILLTVVMSNRIIQGQRCIWFLQIIIIIYIYICIYIHIILWFFTVRDRD